jgi:hypothetical protein
MTEEDEEFERIAAKCKETQRVNESKWHSEMCSNYGGFCKKEWVGLTDEEIQECLQGLPTQTIDVYARRIEAKLKELNK